MIKSQTRFWFYFILFNLLLFLPKYLMDAQVTFLPDFALEETFSGKWELFFRRPNNDIFRLSFDFLLLTFLVYIFRKKLTSSLWVALCFVFYLVLICYQIYHGALTILYKNDPLFYSDYFLIAEGIPIIQEELGIFKLILAAIGLLFLVYGLFLLFHRFIGSIITTKFCKASKISFIVILLLSVFATINFATRLADQRLVFPTISYLLLDNLERSKIVRKDIENFDFNKFQKAYDYSNYALKKKPNVFLLFVESYGKIVYDDEALRDNYLAQMILKESILNKNGWSSASAFSISPVTGGRSWLAYTSFMLGTRIEEQATYRYLVDNEVIKFSGFFQSLQALNYSTYRLSVLPDNRDDIPYDDYSRVYGFDEWIYRRDLDYHGKLYGWGPAPNDQYSLNFANEYMRSMQEPFALFYINLNTHNPFDSPIEVAKDWRALGKGGTHAEKAVSKFFQKPRITDYASAIKFQFDYLTEFILKEGSDNDIFILIGDHQPPLLTGINSGFETPVHIISKDSRLIESFVKAGFSAGMKVKDEVTIFKHEGLYSLIMREFVRNYGKDSLNLPLYLPEGFLMK